MFSFPLSIISYLSAPRACNGLILPLLSISLLITSPIVNASIEACKDSSAQVIYSATTHLELPESLPIQPVGGYYQILSPAGTILQDRLYDMTVFADGRVLAKQDGLWGVVAADGSLIFKFEFDAIEVLNAGLYLLSKRHHGQLNDALVNCHGQWVYPDDKSFENDTFIEPLANDSDKILDYFKVTQQGRSGLINSLGEVLIPIIYDELEHVINDTNPLLAMIVRQGNKTGIINKNHQFIVALKPKQYIDYFDRNYQILRIRGATGRHIESLNWFASDDKTVNETLMTASGKVLLRSDSPITRIHGSNLYKFSEGNKFGIINADLILLLPAHYDEIIDEWQAPLLAKLDNKMGIVRLSGDGRSLTVDNKFESLSLLPVEASNTRGTTVKVAVGEDNTWPVIEYEYHNKLFLAQQHNKFGVIDSSDINSDISNNHEVIAIEYDGIETIGDMLKVKKSGWYGLLDYQGQVIEPIIYDAIRQYDYNAVFYYYVLTKGNKEAILDREGKPILTLSDSDFRIVTEDMYPDHPLIPIEKEGLYGFINKDTKVVAIMPQFESYELIGGYNPLIVQKNGKKILMDSDGTALVKEFDDYSIQRSEYIPQVPIYFVTQNNKEGVIDVTGRIIVKPIFEAIWLARSIRDQEALMLIDQDFLINFITQQDELFGLLDKEGNTLLAPEYSDIMSLTYPPYFILSQPDKNKKSLTLDTIESERLKQAVADTQGNIVTGFDYDAIYVDDQYPDAFLYLVNKTDNQVEKRDSKMDLVETMTYERFHKEIEKTLLDKNS